MKMRNCVLLVFVLCYSFGMAQKIHVVQDNEGIYSISNKYHIKQDSIAKWNQLIIKTNAKGFDEYVHSNGKSVKRGDSLFVENPFLFEQASNNNEKSPASLAHNIDSDEKKDLFENTGSEKDSVSSMISPNSSNDNSGNVIKREKAKQKERKNYYWYFWFFGGVVIGAFIWEKWLRKLLFREKETKYSFDVNDNTSETDGLKKQIQKLTKENRKLKKDREGLEIANRELLEDNIRFEKKLNENFGGNAEAKKQSNNMIRTENNNNAILYADFIIDGRFSCVTESPNDDTNFELHIENKNTASFVIFKPAIPRIVRNPAAFLQGCEKQVVGQTGELEIRREGVAECDANGRWNVVNNNKLNVIIR